MKKSLLVLTILLLAGCSDAPPATPEPQQTAAPTSAAGQPTATSAIIATEDPYPETAEAVVAAFMDEFLADPTGTAAAEYFDLPLRQRVQAGEPIARLVGMQNIPASYAIEPPPETNTEQSAFIIVTLEFEQPEQRLFMLTYSTGRWRIINVQPLV